MRKRVHRGGGPRPLGALVSQVYPSREPEEAFAVRAFAWWIASVPPRVAQNARPVSFSRGILTVHAATSAWVSDLSFLEKQLLEALQARVPEAGVRRLRIRVGPLPPVPTHTRVPEAQDTSPLALEELPESVARALSSIRDDGVRTAVATAARVALGREKADREAAAKRRRR